MNNNNSKKINLHIFHAVQITLFSYFHPTSLPTRKYDIEPLHVLVKTLFITHTFS